MAIRLNISWSGCIHSGEGAFDMGATLVGFNLQEKHVYGPRVGFF